MNNVELYKALLAFFKDVKEIQKLELQSNYSQGDVYRELIKRIAKFENEAISE